MTETTALWSVATSLPRQEPGCHGDKDAGSVYQDTTWLQCLLRTLSSNKKPPLWQLLPGRWPAAWVASAAVGHQDRHERGWTLFILEQGTGLCSNISAKTTTCGFVMVVKSCLILCKPMDCSPPGCSIHGILQTRILK